MSFIESIIHMQNAIKIINYNHGTNIEIFRAVKINREVTIITITDGKNFLDRAFSQCDSDYRINFTIDELIHDICKEWFKTEGGGVENDRNAAEHSILD